MPNCPCGLKKEYLNCCGSYIEGTATPSSPELLMRSRYSAYSKANIAYIKKTMRGKALLGFNEEEALQWAKRVKWLGLQVIKTEVGSDTGFVEFIATYRENNKIYKFHELSRFKQINGTWFYCDGEHIN